MNPEKAHPPAEQIEAAVFGWIDDGAAQRIRAHARNCSRCRPILSADEEVRRQLTRLRADEPSVDVVGAVLGRLEAGRSRRTRHSASHRFVRAGLAAGMLALAMLVLLAPDALRAVVRRLRRLLGR